MNDDETAHEDHLIETGSYGHEQEGLVAPGPLGWMWPSVTQFDDEGHEVSHTPGGPVVEGAVLTGGGWCAPSPVIYDPSLLDVRTLTMPDVSVSRDGIGFEYRGLTAGEKARADADRAEARRIVAHTKRHVGDRALAQHNAVNDAVTEALRHGWTVELHARTNSRFIGISLMPLQRGKTTTIRTTAYESTDEWGGTYMPADDWCEMFES